MSGRTDRRPSSGLRAHHPDHTCSRSISSAFATRGAPGRRARHPAKTTTPPSSHILFSSAGGDGLPGAIDTMLALPRRAHRRHGGSPSPMSLAVPFAVAGTGDLRGDHGPAHRSGVSPHRPSVSVVSASLRCRRLHHRPPSHPPCHDRPGTVLVHRTGQPASLQWTLLAIGGPTTGCLFPRNQLRDLPDMT